MAIIERNNLPLAAPGRLVGSSVQYWEPTGEVVITLQFDSRPLAEAVYDATAEAIQEDHFRLGDLNLRSPNASEVGHVPG